MSGETPKNGELSEPSDVEVAAVVVRAMERAKASVFGGLAEVNREIIWHEYDSSGMAQVIESYADDVKAGAPGSRDDGDD